MNTSVIWEIDCNKYLYYKLQIVTSKIFHIKYVFAESVAKFRKWSQVLSEKQIVIGADGSFYPAGLVEYCEMLKCSTENDQKLRGAKVNNILTDQETWDIFLCHLGCEICDGHKYTTMRKPEITGKVVIMHMITKLVFELYLSIWDFSKRDVSIQKLWNF